MREMNKLSQAVRLALLAGALSVPTVAIAAETAKTTKLDAVEVKAATKTIELEEIGLEEEEVEKITVTGSRIRRAEFSSASPVQIIDGQISRELGLFNAADMLQSSSQSSGTQIDSSFGGFVLDNGPGSTTIGFRGLGASRTLVLINGKRMVSAGAGGAPVAADLSLVPSVMIDRVENLFDGASTVYGSDAIAGVANAILKTDVEGFEFEGSYAQPKGDGGEKTILSAMYGKTFDNGFVNVGVEYSDEKNRSLKDNPFTSGCDEFLYEDEEGNRYTQDRSTGPVKEGFGSCNIFPLTNRVDFEDTLWRSLYYTPGSTNTGVPNFSETGVPVGWVDFHPDWYAADPDGDGVFSGFVDGDGDGYKDVSFRDPFYAFSLSDRAKSADLTGQTKRISVVLNSDYNFQDDNNTKVYFEALYAKRNSDAFSPGGQAYPEIPADNPYNPCGSYSDIDCGAGLVNWGPSSAEGRFNIRGDRDQNRVDVSQYRAVTGITGDLTLLDNFGAGGWFYDAYVSFAGSSGTFKVQGIHEERLNTSLAAVVNDDGSITCGNGSDGCVPVNFFADNIYQMGGGSFTDAEAEYLFVDRVVTTDVKQTIFNGFVSGELYSLPWNGETVATVFGAEFRKDEIDTDANDIATEGLLHSYFADKGARGSRNLRELFVEFDAPLIRGQKFAEELTITAAGRWTDESFYDAQTTYSLKAVYRPVEWVTLRGTKGSSYRAPNLRERFILGTSGFTTVTDSCVVPELARTASEIGGSETYDPTQDSREQHVLDSCIAQGVDPLSLGLGEGANDFLPRTGVESETSGTQVLDPETSVSKTWGVILEQPFSEDFDLTFSLTKFDIEITNSIIEPTEGYVVGQCYDNKEEPTGGSGFCSKIVRGSNGQIDMVNPGFINVGFESAKGYDYNIYYQQEFLVGSQNLGVTLDVTATKMTEQAEDILGSYDNNVGEVHYPEWKGNARLALTYDDFRFTWNTQYIGGGAPDEEDLSEFSADNDACRGLFVNGVAVTCREIDYTDSYTMHTASLNWAVDNYSVTLGVRNVFNDAPPKVDSGRGGFNIRNIPAGVGYDLNGRTAFLNFKVAL